jgi:hypothetical protein
MGSDILITEKGSQPSSESARLDDPVDDDIAHLRVRDDQVPATTTFSLLALTSGGEILTLSFVDLNIASRIGNAMTEAGVWKTWDAFKVSTNQATGQGLVASYVSVPVTHGS